MSAYCGFVKNKGIGTVHEHYHDNLYGFPLTDDNALFGRLVLEIFQAGLSWEIILKKQEAFYKAFDAFDIEKVSRYDEEKVNALLADTGIIRNRLKITSVIENARRITVIQKSHGSFYNWLLAHHPLPKADWVKLFKQNFKFTGGEIVNEFLMSTGILPGAHPADCPVYQTIAAAKPLWMRI